MQSFAYKVKSELCRQPVSRQCCARAEAYGVLLFCNTFSSAEVRIITENPEFAGRLPRLFQRAFSLKFDSLPDGTRDKLIFRITRQEKLRRIVDLLGYDPSLVLHVNFGLLEDECCRTAYIKLRTGGFESCQVYRPHGANETDSSPYTNGREIFDDITFILFKSIV